MEQNNPSSPVNSIISRLMSVKMKIQNVLYISYAVPANAVQPLLPPSLIPAAVSDETAFISLVGFQSRHVRLNALPLFKFDYNQFNIRTYVIDPVYGHHAAYFIRSYVTSKLISFATSAMGISWQYCPLTITPDSTNGTRSLSISGSPGEALSIKSESDAEPDAAPSPFISTEEAVDFLIRPRIGFSGDTRNLERFTIHHPEVNPERWQLAAIEYPLIGTLLPIHDEEKPHSVFFLSEADFSVFLPPSRIKK